MHYITPNRTPYSDKLLQDDFRDKFDIFSKEGIVVDNNNDENRLYEGDLCTPLMLL